MRPRFALLLTSAPAYEPLTLGEAKEWVRIDAADTGQDATVTDLISGARQRCERVTGRALITQTWRLSLDRFPGFPGADHSYPGDSIYLGLEWDERAIFLPRPPLASVTSITYVDTAGVTQTLSGALYQTDADGEPARVMPAYGQPWPVARAQLDAVKVTYSAGASAAPAEIKNALRAHVAYCYRVREDQDQLFLDSLFAPFKVWGWET